MPDTAANVSKCTKSDLSSSVLTTYDDFAISDGGIRTVPNSSKITSSNLVQIPFAATAIEIVQGDNIVHNHTLGKGSGTGAAATDICLVFSGKAGVTVNYRTGKSGSSFALANHLLAACPKGTFPVGATATEDFTTLFAGGTVPAAFKSADGSEGMYKAVYGKGTTV